MRGRRREREEEGEVRGERGLMRDGSAERGKRRDGSGERESVQQRERGREH